MSIAHILIDIAAQWVRLPIVYTEMQGFVEP